MTTEDITITASHMSEAAPPCYMYNLYNDLNVLPEEPNGNVNVKDLVKGTVDFEAMNVQALRKFAKENNIDLKGCGNDKDKIVTRIKGE